jgi:hypothetical protein
MANKLTTTRKHEITNVGKNVGKKWTLHTLLLGM